MLKRLLFAFLLSLPFSIYAQNPCIDGSYFNTTAFAVPMSSTCGLNNDWSALGTCDNGLNNMEDVVYGFNPGVTGTYNITVTFPTATGVYSVAIRTDCNFDQNTGCIYSAQGTGVITSNQNLNSSTIYYIKLDGFGVANPLTGAPPCITSYSLNISLVSSGSPNCFTGTPPVLAVGTTKVTTGQMGSYTPLGTLPSNPSCFDNTIASDSLEKASKPDVFKIVYQRGMVVAVTDAFYYMTMELMDKGGCNVIDCISVHCTGATCGTNTYPTYPRGNSTTYKAAPAFSLDGRGFTPGDTIVVRLAAYIPITPLNLLTDVSTTDGNQYYDLTLSIKPDNNVFTAPTVTLCDNYSVSNHADADAVVKDSESPAGCGNFTIENNIFYRFCTDNMMDTALIQLSNLKFLNTDPLYNTLELALLQGPVNGPYTTVYCQTGIGAAQDIKVGNLSTNTCYWLMLDGSNGARFNLDLAICDIKKPTLSLSLIDFNDPCVGDYSGSIEVKVVSTPAGISPTLTWNTSPIQTGATATGLTDGTYTLTAKIGALTRTISHTLVSSEQVKIDKITFSGANCNSKKILLNVYAHPKVFNNSVAVLDGTLTSTKFNDVSDNSFYWQFKDLAPGTYNLKVYRQNATGCVFDTMINVAPNVIPTYTYKVTDATCFGKADGFIDVTVKGGFPPYTFNVNANNPVKADTFARIRNFRAGKFFILITDQAMCSPPSLNFEVKQPTKVTHKVEDFEKAFCDLANGQVTISTTGGNGPYVYALDDADFFTSDDTDGYVFKYVKAGKHLLSTRDRRGCLDTFTYNLATVPLMTTKSVKNVAALCEANIGEQISVVSGSFKPYEYVIDNDLFPQPTRDSIFLSNLSPGIHRLKITDSMGCEYFEPISIERKSSITGIQYNNSSVNCNQTDADIWVTGVQGGLAPFSYRLAPLYEDFSGLDYFHHITPGKYKLFVSYQEDCIDSSSWIYILPKTIPDTPKFTYNPGGKLTLINNYGLVQFNQQVPNMVKYEWDFGDGTQSSDSIPAHVYTLPGSYPVTLTVTNSDGCSNTYTRELVTEDKPGLFIPEAFSPNGDGDNDIWNITGINIKTFEARVYDRWGGLIFSTQDINSHWDAKLRSGSYVEDGTYVFMIKATNINDEPLIRNGLLTIVR